MQSQSSGKRYLSYYFSQEGIEIVDFGEEADLYIVNSCAVTKEAENKTRQSGKQDPAKKSCSSSNINRLLCRLITQEGQNPLNNQSFLLPQFLKKKKSWLW
jgi:hypothetical protein